MLFIDLRLARGGFAVFYLFTCLPSLLGIVDLAAFSRAIERRYSSVSDQFSALQAVTRAASLWAEFHDDRPRSGSAELWGAALARGPRCSRACDALVEEAKLGNVKKNTNVGGDDRAAVAR